MSGHHGALDVGELPRLLRWSGSARVLRKAHPRSWQRLVRLGMYGQLAGYLGLNLHRWTVGTRLRTLARPQRWPRLQADLAGNFPPGTLHDMIVGALLESVVFARLKFMPEWCNEGKHWFISNDRRRKDCPEHRSAGQKARYRRNPSVREKENKLRRERRARGRPN